MKKQMFGRRYSLTLSAVVVAVLLLATLLLAGSVASAGEEQNADHAAALTGGRTAIRSPEKSAHPLRPSPRPQSADSPSVNPLPESADSPSVDSSSTVMFIENVGQWDDRARFQVRGGPGTMWLTENALWITLLEKPDEETRRQSNEELFSPSPRHPVSPSPQQGVNLKLTFPDANPHPRIEPFGRLDTKVSYFIGNNPDKWHPDVPVWAGVRYVDLYPGVDLEITSRSDRWTWRLVCRAKCPSVLQNVRLRVEGAEELVLDDESLRLTTVASEFTLPLLQMVTTDGKLSEMADVQPTLTGNEIRLPFIASTSNFHSPSSTFQSSQDNPDDLFYSTFLGGSSSDMSSGIAVDGTGNAYMTGQTKSADFPATAGAFDDSLGGYDDAFVAKLAPDGTSLEYATFLGGGEPDQGNAIAVDEVGNGYVTGQTRSGDFPTTTEAFDRSHNGGWVDAFAVKLDPNGILIYSTFLGGGDGEDEGHSIAVDQMGNAYVAGSTQSSDFPTTTAAFDTSYNGDWHARWDAFVVKLNDTGSALTYATFLGSEGSDGGYGIAVDGAGSAYVTGRAGAADFPTTPGAFDQDFSYGSTDAFVVKLSPDGATLAYSTFLGGSDGDYGWGIAVDGAGNAYVTGQTKSADFPTTTGAFDTNYNDDWDAFVAKLSSDGATLSYATFLGDTEYDRGNAIAVDGIGGTYVTGETASTNFPTTSEAFDQSLDGYNDAFVVKLDTDDPALAYATFLGGTSYDKGYAIALDELGNVYVTGRPSADFPTTTGASDTTYNGGDAFVVKLAAGNEIGSTYSISGEVTDDAGNPIPDVTVSASGPASLYTTTASDGTYTFSDLPAGTYSVSASLADYTFLPRPRTVSVPPDAAGQDFTGYGKSISETLYLDTFEPGNDGIIGPISSKAPLYEGTKYRIVISGTWSAWFPSAWTSLCKGIPEDKPQIPSPDIANGKVGIDAEYLFAAPEGTGPCSNPDDPPTPVEEPIEVSVDNGATWQKLMSVSGVYNSEHIYDYLINGRGFPLLFRKAEFPTDDNYGILKIRIAGPIPTYSISGQVTDDAGNPVADATVGASGPISASTHTGSDGTYTLINLPAGTYTINASKDRYASPSSESVTLPPDATDVDLTLQHETYSITGQVTDDAGNPIAGVTISDDAGHTASTDSSGNYTFSELPAGTYTLTPSKSGYTFSPASRTVSVPPDAVGVDFMGTPTLIEPLTLTPLYPPAGQVSRIMQGGTMHRYFELRDANGMPAPYVTVSFDPAGSGTSDANGLLDVAVDADALGGPGSYNVTAVSASRWGQSYDLAQPVSFNIEVQERPFTHHWYGGTVRKAKGGISAGLVAYLEGQIKGGLGWSLTEMDAGIDTDDRLRLREQFQGEGGGGKGLGAELGIKGGISSIEGGATATGELKGLGLAEWQSYFDSPYTDPAQKAQAAFVLSGLKDMAVGAPGQPLLAAVLTRVLPDSSYDAYTQHIAGGVGAEWTPAHAHAGAEIKLLGISNSLLKLEALDAETTLRLFGTLTDYQMANEWGLSLEQEVSVDLDLLAVQTPFKQKLGYYVGEHSTKISEELFIDKITNQPVRFELSLTGQGNTDTFNNITLNAVTYTFIVEGEDLDLALQRVRNLTALLAAWDAVQTEGLIVGRRAALREVNAYLTNVPLSRYEVTASTEGQLTVVPEIGFTAGIDVDLGAGAEFKRGREIVVERGYATVTGLYRTEVYPDRQYGSQAGKDIWDLLGNAAAGAWSVVKDAFNSIRKKVEQGVSWAVDLAGKTKDGIIRGGAHLFGGSNITFQAVTLDGTPLAATQAFTITATSWVPELGGVSKAGRGISSRLLSTSGEGFAIGGIYHFQPYTMTLEPAATLVLTYTAEAVGTADPNAFDVYRRNPQEHNWAPQSATHDIASRAMTTTVSQLGTYAIGYDVTAPTVQPLQPSTLVTTTHFLQFTAILSDSGSGVDPDSVSMNLAGAPVSATYAPLTGRLWYTATTFLPNGVYTYTIAAADTAGNAVSHEDSFNVAVPDPDILSVEPPTVYQGTARQVTVQGATFAYSATLALEGQPLTDTGYLGSTTYTATVLSDLGYGLHDLTLTNPDGGTDTLADAISVTVPGDVTRDCAVGIEDVQAVAALWRQAAWFPHDFDGDNWGTVADIMHVAAAWGDTCQ